MSRFDEIRVAYTDDPSRRGLQGRSMTRHALQVELRPVIVPTEFLEEVVPVKGYRPGDPAQLRGIPVVGAVGGLGGAVRGSKPHVDGLR